MYKDILVPVDLNTESSWRKSLPVACELCHLFGARLHVMTVVPDFGLSMVSQFFPAGYEHKVTEEANKRLHELVREIVPDDITVQHIVAEGNIYREIIHMGKEVKVDLIVMGSHHPELEDYLIGPNALKVVQHADCSVMVVRD